MVKEVKSIKLCSILETEEGGGGGGGRKLEGDTDR